MGKFLHDFKEFALKGNVVDMAVGVIVGGAFGKIVSSLVNDILMPVFSIVTGGDGYKNLKNIITKDRPTPDDGAATRPSNTSAPGPGLPRPTERPPWRRWRSTTASSSRTSWTS